MNNLDYTERSFAEIKQSMIEEAVSVRDLLDRCVSHPSYFVDPIIQNDLRIHMLALADEIVASRQWMEKRGVDPTKVFRK